MPNHLEIATLEYHSPVRSYASTISRILVQGVVSYDPSQPSIPTLLSQTPSFIPSSPMNPITGGQSPEQAVTANVRTNLNLGQSVAIGRPMA